MKQTVYFVQPSESVRNLSQQLRVDFNVTTHEFECYHSLGEAFSTEMPTAVVVTLRPDVTPDTIQSLTGISGLVPVIVVAHESTVELRLTAARAGASAFLLAPVKPRVMIETISSLICTPKLSSVLVVGSVETRNQHHVAHLNGAGYAAGSASNSTTALSLVIENNPDVVLLDTTVCSHPMGGVALVRAIRQLDKYRTRPVIILADRLEESEREEHRKLGVAAVIPRFSSVSVVQSAVRVAVDQCYGANSMQLDGLTGVVGRAAAITMLGYAISHTSGWGILVDLDGYGEYNDRYGFSVGDDCIRLLADTITSIVPHHWVVGRSAGDQFLIVAIGAKLEEVNTTLDQIDALWRNETSIASIPYTTYSVGIAPLRTGASVAHTLHSIEHARYSAKDEKPGSRYTSDSRVK